MKIKYQFLLAILLTFFLVHAGAAQSKKLLLFTKTNGYRHASIPAGIAAIQKLGTAAGYAVEHTEDSLWFTNGRLKDYAAVIFLSCSGKILGPEEEKALQQYIQAGGGFVGIHAATTCEYNWPWYGKLIGAVYDGHPDPQLAKLFVVDKQQASTRFLPDVWNCTDEWYNFKDINPDIKILITLDEHSYTGGTNGDHHPIAWYHDFEGGRSFYTGLGDADSVFSDTLFLRHLWGGIEYAIGSKKPR